MSRPAVGARRPSASAETEAKPSKTLDDTAMKTVTTAIRRDLWRELNKVAVDREVTIQAVMNRAVFDYLSAQGYTIAIPLNEE